MVYRGLQNPRVLKIFKAKWKENGAVQIVKLYSEIRKLTFPSLVFSSSSKPLFVAWEIIK